MRCPRCGRRKARRACPALGQQICPVCCGTQRLVEIACPDDCGFLTTARSHPPAVVQRRRERDSHFLASIAHVLTQQQYQTLLFLLFAVRRARPESSTRLVDTDVAEAAGALAATLETASKGIIYEHRPASRPAQDLGAELTKAVKELGEHAGRPVDGDAAVALQSVRRAALEAAAALREGDTACLDWIDRLIGEAEGRTTDGSAPSKTSGLVSPTDPQGPRLIRP